MATSRNLKREPRMRKERPGRFFGRLGRETVPSAVLWLAVLAAPADGQTPAVRRVEFDEAVKTALERSPTIDTANAAVSEASALVLQAQSATRPSLLATMNNTTNDSQRGFSGGVVQPRSQFTFGISAQAPLFVASRWAEVGQARDRVDLASENVAETRRQVALSAAQAYLSVIAAQRQLEVDQRALDTARAHLEYADRRLEGGVGSRLNQLRAAQAVSDNESRLENARLALRRAQEVLGVEMAENGPVDAGAVPALEAPAAGTQAEWLQNRPDVRAQATAIRVANRVVRDTRRDWLPTAGVSFDPSYITPSGLFQPSRTWRLTFSVIQPVFDPTIRAATAVRRVALDRAEYTRNAIEIRARSEIRIAEESVQSYGRALVSARLAAEQAAEVLRISTAAFEVGATTNIEVIDAQRSARDAATLAEVAEDALRRARLELLVAIGRFPL
jgi:outer membrane protein TolC